MPTTSNFGWTTPADTDLVKDGALAIRTLGNGIDTSMAELKGGTTGQVLSKTSNTDMDFTWVTTDDANAIQNAIVDAKGDLIAASANDTPARLAVGNNGETLLADSSQTTGLRWGNNLGFTAGKNKIINGDFAIWQRGTSFTQGVYNADRFTTVATGSTGVITREAFTAGSAPVAGYESQYFCRNTVTSVAGAGNFYIFTQYIEDVRTLANQTVTFSFWAKADTTKDVSIELNQNFGSGGSSTVNTNGGKVSLTTSWARYSVTVSLPSISGKTIGANNFLGVRFWLDAGSNFNSRTTSLGQQNITFDSWGWQLESGSVATAFQTATGTLAGELAACQRYYVRYDAGTENYVPLTPLGFSTSTTNVTLTFQYPVVLRGQATAVDYANLSVYGGSGGAFIAVSSITMTRSSKMIAELAATVTGATSNNVYRLQPNNAAGYIGFSAEL